VLKKQSETMFQKNAQLLEQIIEQEHVVHDKMFLDKRTGLDNMTKYAYDNELKKYNKMCMISVSKSQMFLAHLGEDTMAKILRETVAKIRKLLGNTSYAIYKHNACSVLIVTDGTVTQGDFLKLAESLYQNFDKIIIPELDVTLILNFSVVMTNRNLLEKARYCSYEAEASNTRYMVYDNTAKEDKTISSTLRMVTIISDALANDRVVPYFQPIYDNRVKKFNKAEALMRIADKEGNIYSPAQFMDIANDYKIYLEISKAMILKVFDLFEHRSESVSLNISAYDVSEKNTREAIYNRLERMSKESRSHFVFEVLESEEYRDQLVLKEFIRRVREYGAKISIDDFGSGYSNLLEIASLEPDYIKIDGQLIKDLNSDNRKQVIVDTIVYMANRFEVNLIAEMVESEDIQNMIVDKSIAYTQGYYFAKPMDYEHLEAFLNTR
jgi:EAL domain-containing protein (putative c-di-GMP-specific phosphodiesterase class I)